MREKAVENLVAENQNENGESQIDGNSAELPLDEMGRDRKNSTGINFR